MMRDCRAVFSRSTVLVTLLLIGSLSAVPCLSHAGEGKTSKTNMAAVWKLLYDKKPKEAWNTVSEVLDGYTPDSDVMFVTATFRKAFRIYTDTDDTVQQHSRRGLAIVTAIKGKEKKSPLDYVKLVLVEPIGKTPVDITGYLKELTSKFPKSQWVDWAEIRLWQEGPEYKETADEPLAQDDKIRFITDYLKQKPESYMKPTLLKALADLYHQRAIHLHREVLKTEGADRFTVAGSREGLRQLGAGYVPEVKEGDADKDRKTMRFLQSIPSPVLWRTAWEELQSVKNQKDVAESKPKADTGQAAKQAGGETEMPPPPPVPVP